MSGHREDDTNKKRGNEMKLIRTKRNFSSLIIVVVLLFPLYSGNSSAAQKKERSQTKSGQVIQLRSIDQLKEAFQRDGGKVRFVTILSPT